MIDDRALVLSALHRLAEAARKGQPPDAHPTVEEIVAYHAGELPQEEERELQQHLLGCRECPDLILALDQFPQLAEGDVLPPPASMESAWAEVRRQLRKEGWFRSSAAPRRSWRTAPWLLPVAAVLVMAAALSLLFFQHNQPLERVEQARADRPQLEIYAAQREVGPVQEVGDARSAGGFTLVAKPEGRWDFPEYRVDLRSSEGKPRWSEPWRPRSPTTPFFLAVPRGSLAEGEYLLRFAPQPAGTTEERRFRLRYR